MSRFEHEQQPAQKAWSINRPQGADVADPSESFAGMGIRQQSDVLSEQQGSRDERALMPFPTRQLQETPIPEPVCPKCKGAGWLRKDSWPWEPQHKSRIECECLLKKRRLKRLEEMLSLCERFGFRRDKKLATFRAQVRGVQQALRETKGLIESLINFAKEREERERTCQRDASKVAAPKKWLVLIGPSGVGKTHLAMAVGSAGLDAGLVTIFAVAADLLDHLRQAFDPAASVSYDELFERFKNADVLILDDLGAEQSSSWADEKLFQLLNHRYNLGLPTVVTMNKRAWDFLDTRLQSRLSDRSLVSRVVMDQAKDFRAQQGMVQKGE